MPANTNNARRKITYLACWACYPLTLVECALMTFVAGLAWACCRIFYCRLWYPERSRQHPASTVKQKIDVHNALVTMQTLERIGRESGVQVFWISGTLLGLERLGHPLPHDTDMDAGVLIDDPRYPQFIEALRASTEIASFAPQYVSLKARIQNPDLHVIPGGIMRYKSTIRNTSAPEKPPIKTDIFLHFRYRDGLMHGSRNTLWWNSPFQVVQKSYGDWRCSVPADAHLHLTENYGDYRTEVKEFENSVDCPNAMDIFSWRSLGFLLRRQQVLLRLDRVGRARQVGRRVRRTILKGINPLRVR